MCLEGRREGTQGCVVGVYSEKQASHAKDKTNEGHVIGCHLIKVHLRRFVVEHFLQSQCRGECKLWVDGTLVECAIQYLWSFRVA